MRARLAVAANALGCEDLPLQAANLAHRVLLGEINAHAGLVFSDKADLAAFLQAVRSEASLPQDARKGWTETMIRLRKLGRITVAQDRPKPLAQVGTLSELRTAWANSAEVAVIANSACSTLEVPPSGLRSDPGMRPDVVTSLAVTEAEPLRRIQLLEGRALLAKGTERDVFWRDVLEPLANGATSATVLDRYLFRPALDIAFGRPWTRDWVGEHLGWLLARLDEAMSPGSEVRLIGQCPSPYSSFSADATAQAVRDVWGPSQSGRLASVALFLAPATSGSRFPHDRHIRLSTGAAIGLTAGFDRLRAETVQDVDGMAWSFSWRPESLQALEEKELRGASYAPAVPASVLRR